MATKDIHPEFVAYAIREGISLDNVDDYKTWYECWKDGWASCLTNFEKLGVDVWEGAKDHE